jgi:hypothetical protein
MNLDVKSTTLKDFKPIFSLKSFEPPTLKHQSHSSISLLDLISRSEAEATEKHQPRF